MIYERTDDGELTSGGGVTEDGKWYVMSTSKGTQRMNEIHFKDLTKPDSPILPLVADRTNSWGFVGNDGPVFYFRTDKDAERGKLVSVNVLATRTSLERCSTAGRRNTQRRADDQ